MKKEKEISESISIKILDNTYSFNIQDLTNGSLIDIERLKVALSNDTHGSMLFATSKQGQLAYITVDAIATLSILLPALTKDLRVDSLVGLHPMKTQKLIKAYREEFYPWWKQWIDKITGLTEEEEEEIKAPEIETKTEKEEVERV